jgi:hypothetical protein
MLLQTELLSPAALRDEISPAVAERIVQFITAEIPDQPFTLDLVVHQVHGRWESWIGRAVSIGTKLGRFEDRCRERAQAVTGPERRRLRCLADRANALAGLALQLANTLFAADVEAFSAVLELDEDLHDTFWQDVLARPGIEVTWQLTLGQIIHYLRRKPSLPSALSNPQS